MIIHTSRRLFHQNRWTLLIQTVPVVVQLQSLLSCGRSRNTCCAFHQQQQCVNAVNI
jgi:hypothetical protein